MGRHAAPGHSPLFTGFECGLECRPYFTLGWSTPDFRFEMKKSFAGPTIPRRSEDDLMIVLSNLNTFRQIDKRGVRSDACGLGHRL